MECTYSVNINGEKIELFSSDIQIDSYEKLVSEIRKQAFKDPSKFKEILKIVSEANSFENITVDNINDNSVGFYSPAELINNLVKNNYDRSKWKSLKIPDKVKNKSIVSIGFGTDGQFTGVYGTKVYLNLNNTDLESNQIIALTELALHQNIEGYKNNFSDLINSTNEEDEKTVSEYLNKIVKNSRNDSDTFSFLERKIKSAYYKSNIKSDLGSRNVSVARENLEKTYETYNKLLLDKELKENNYLPRTYVKVTDLKQGDLISIPNPTTLSKNETYWDYYEIFYDYYTDPNGEIVIRTIHKTKEGAYFLKKRESLQPSVNEENKQTSKKSSTVIARIYNPDVYDAYNYSNNIKYIEIPLKYKNSAFKYEWTLDLLKQPDSKILIKKKRGAKSKTTESEANPDKVEVQESGKALEIEKIKGSTIYLKDGSELNISDLEYISISSNLFSDLDVYSEEVNSQFNFKYLNPSVGDRVIVNRAKDKSSEELVIGKVIAFVNTPEGNRFTYVYKNGDSFKTASTYYVKAVANPIDPSLRLTLTEIADFTTVIKNKLKDKTVGKATIENKGIFGLNLENLTYSVEDVNTYSSFKYGNVLYNTEMKTFHKIIESKLDYIKTAVDINGKLVYMDIKKDNLKDYVMFTNQLNTAFANANIWKNRYVLYTSPGENTMEVNVWRNPNGYIWVYDVNSSKDDLKDHKNYEEGMILYNNEMKEILKERYKLSELPEHLYQSTKFSGMKDSYNTTPISVDNINFKKIINNDLLNFIVPGSFITFFGDKDSYIVERVSKDGLVIAKYVYTKSKSNNVDPDLQYVKSEKFILNKELLDAGLEISTIHLPRWATASYDVIKEFRVESSPIKKSIENTDFADSKEFVLQLSDIISNKYGVKVNLYDNSEIAEFGDDTLFGASAFTKNGELYINIDKASIAEPLHELLHVILATMKASNPDTYYRLVNSVQYHPMFKEVVQNYDDINTELLEETFVQLFSKTFRKNIKKEGIFNQDIFNSGIKSTIEELLELSDTLDWENTFDIMGKPIKNILIDFGSALLQKEEGLIDYDKVSLMFGISGIIKNLLDDGKLEQNCNY